MVWEYFSLVAGQMLGFAAVTWFENRVLGGDGLAIGYSSSWIYLMRFGVERGISVGMTTLAVFLLFVEHRFWYWALKCPLWVASREGGITCLLVLR